MQREQDQGVAGRHAARRSTQPSIRRDPALLLRRTPALLLRRTPALLLRRTPARLLALALCLAGVGACSPGSSEQPSFTPPTYYKPGVALSRVSCSCLACVSAGACEGRAPMARDENGCEDGFQMTQSTRFEATVKSCQPSCFKRNWSVPDTKECDDQLPDDCCPD